MPIHFLVEVMAMRRAAENMRRQQQLTVEREFPRDKIVNRRRKRRRGRRKVAGAVDLVVKLQEGKFRLPERPEGTRRHNKPQFHKQRHLLGQPQTFEASGADQQKSSNTVSPDPTHSNSDGLASNSVSNLPNIDPSDGSRNEDKTMGSTATIIPYQDEQQSQHGENRNFEPAKLRCRGIEELGTNSTLKAFANECTSDHNVKLKPAQLDEVRKSLQARTSKMYSHFPSMLDLIVSLAHPIYGIRDGTVLIQRGEMLEQIVIVLQGALVEPEKVYEEGSVIGIENLIAPGVCQRAVMAWTDAKLQKDECILAVIEGVKLRSAMRDHSVRCKQEVRALIDLNSAFVNLPGSIKDELGLCLQERLWQRGEHLMTEGELGEEMIFVEEGVADVSITKGDVATVVAQVEKGSVVGEGALFDETSTRSASVIAKTAIVKGRSLLYHDFHSIVGEDAERLLQELFYAKILKGCKTFKSMPVDQIEELSSSATKKHYSKGDYIVKEGDVGNELFIVVRGKVSFFKLLPKGPKGKLVNSELGSVFSGSVFGEGALVDKKPRSASCVASSDNGAECAIITFSDYNRCIRESEDVTESLRKDFKQRDEGDFSTADLANLEPICQLGEGAAGRVLLVRHQVTGRTAALKAINIAEAIEKGYGKYAAAEASILKAIHHPFLCSLYRTLKNTKQVFLVIEPVLGGELLHFMLNNPDLVSEEKNIQFYVGQCVDVLCYLHRLKIAYRDVKPENLMLDSNGYVKLVDFGFAKKLSQGTHVAGIMSSAEETFTMCGTPEYMAPEVYSMSGHGTTADWWSVGILTHELFVGIVPFQGESTLAIMESIGRYDRLYPKNVSFSGEHISEHAANLMLGLLCPKEHKRLGSKSSRQRLEKCELYSHPFFGSLNWRSLRARVLPAPYVPEIKSNYDTHNFDGFDSFSLDLNDNESEDIGIFNMPSWTLNF